jgi:hypothetical protein
MPLWALIVVVWIVASFALGLLLGLGLGRCRRAG